MANLRMMNGGRVTCCSRLIRHSPFAIRHSPFAIRHSPFAIRLLRLRRATQYALRTTPYPPISRLIASKSASTIIWTNSSKLTVGSQPRFAPAFEASPISKSTSAGR